MPIRPSDDDPLRAAFSEARRRIRRAKDFCLRRDPDRCTPDDIVAELPFGFWTSLLSNGSYSGYGRRLWHPTLHKAFPYYEGPRNELHMDLEAIRHLRNRIMHHEPVHRRDLAADRATVLRLIGYLDPGVAAEIRARDRIPSVLAARPL